MNNSHGITIMVRENSNSFHIGAWCNGNTTVFGAVIIGSNPIVPTNGQIIIKHFVSFKVGYLVM